MFEPLNVMTDYSMLQSMITIPKLLTFLKKNQCNVCGICDVNLFGVMEFYDTMKLNNIKPIIGLEIKTNNITLYLYARDYKGYQSLLYINMLDQQKKETLKEIEASSKNLNIVLPYEFVKEYEKLQHLPNLFIGYSSEYEKNNAFILTDKVVFCPKLKALTKNDANSLSLLKAIDLGESLKLIEPVSSEKNSFEYYLENHFKDQEYTTDTFIKSCNVEIPKQNRYIPKFDPEKDSKSYLLSLAKKGMEKRFGNKINDTIIKRLKYELSVIQNMGFEDYFLIVYDYVRYAKQNHILVGAGRGSAVGSLVSYCLGITDVNPIEYNLLFERFLNPERVTMPDIDIDFDEEQRDKVVSYVKKRYNKECVANIMTFGTLKSKLVLRSVGKALEIHPSLIDSFVPLIDGKISLQENLERKEIQYYLRNQDIKKLYEESLKIEGLKKHISTHAAGVVISSVPLYTVIPVYYNEQELLTGLTMNYLEELGLLKMDFLALRNLTIMKNVIQLIEENTNTHIDLNQINLNDPKVLRLFHEADTIGIFQFESEGMKSFLKKLKPNCFLDIVNAIALYRPGPMENIDSFIRRKEHKEKVEYFHESLKPILEETYGILIYQEQIMQILVTMGGFSFAKADIYRRAMSKKKKEIMEQGEEEFIKGALKNGYEKELAQKIFDLILKFANYGFNKSHSVSYAFIGYQMAYLKSYYPLYFIANLLNMNVDGTAKTIEYISMAKKMGITLLPLDINKSGLNYKIENASLRFPFMVLNNLGEEASKMICLEQEKKPFQDFFDFVARCYGKSVTKKTLEILIDADAFHSFTTNHNALKANIDAAINYATLASDLEENFITKPHFTIVSEESTEEKRIQEYKSFGFYISNHPASKYTDPTILKMENIQNFYDKHVTSIVLIEKMKKIQTKKQETMAFVTASDETGTGNLVVFADSIKYLDPVQVGDVVLVQGRVARRFLEYQINVNKIEKLETKERV